MSKSLVFLDGKFFVCFQTEFSIGKLNGTYLQTNMIFHQNLGHNHRLLLMLCTRLLLEQSVQTNRKHDSFYTNVFR